MGTVPVIGGFEMIYRARQQVWVLHANLVVIGGKKSARKNFKQTFGKDDIERPIIGASLKNPAEQLSYILKFSTYHRPHQQRGSRKAIAKPLNPREHAALVKWMAQFDFEDFLLLINARRQGGTKITLQNQAD